MPPSIAPLSFSNHDRDRVGLRYVYPVVSRRAGGVSIGINLNPNNACNWACIYCQVPDLTRGGPPPLDLPLLKFELNRMLDDVLLGDFMRREVPDGVRSLKDIAFSGNGEPTSASEFADAMACVAEVMRERKLHGVKLRLITNGSLVYRPVVQTGLRILAGAGGEVWFKVDAIDERRTRLINGVSQKSSAVLARLRQCAALAPTWIQTCMMAIDGMPPDEAELCAYLQLLEEIKSEIRGVLLYGLARPSMQPGAGRLSPLPEVWMKELGERVKALGLPVTVSL